jgi:transposase
MPKKNGKRYSEQERTRILTAAQREGLTGKQASKRFGVSEVTMWKWRRDANGATPKRQPREQRAARITANGSLAALVRAQMQDQVRTMLPEIVREEVARALVAK